MWCPNPYRPKDSPPTYVELSHSLRLICLNPGKPLDALPSLLDASKRGLLPRILSALSCGTLRMPKGVKRISVCSMNQAIGEVRDLAAYLQGSVDQALAINAYFGYSQVEPNSFRHSVLRQNRGDLLIAAKRLLGQKA